MQGRAHVVEHLEDVKDLSTDYSSMKEIWKDSIQASEQELKEREEEQASQMDVEETWIVCYKCVLNSIGDFTFFESNYIKDSYIQNTIASETPDHTLFSS